MYSQLDLAAISPLQSADWKRSRLLEAEPQFVLPPPCISPLQSNFRVRENQLTGKRSRLLKAEPQFVLTIEKYYYITVEGLSETISVSLPLKGNCLDRRGVVPVQGWQHWGVFATVPEIFHPILMVTLCRVIISMLPRLF